jgi:ABC transporter substrate binding protein/Tripartite tricarboxylate transporter family receptor
MHFCAYHPRSGSISPLMISTPTVSPPIICFSRVALAIVLVLLQLPAQAQNYPTRAIRLISPFPASGANDVLAGKLAERLRGSVVVENRPGAGAVIGLTVLARSAPDGFTVAHRRQIIDLAGRYRLPAIAADKPFTVGGGLASYGANPTDPFRRAANYVDRILRGEKPADLPVQSLVKFELVINLKTARALSLTVPHTLLVAADELIE